MSGVVAQDKHPLEDYFQAEILTDEAMKEVLVDLELDYGSTPTKLEAEIYHTDLEKKIVGLKVEVENTDKSLKYEMVIELEVMPYEKAMGEQIIFRSADLRDEGVTLKVIETPTKNS